MPFERETCTPRVLLTANATLQFDAREWFSKGDPETETLPGGSRCEPSFHNLIKLLSAFSLSSSCEYVQ